MMTVRCHGTDEICDDHYQLTKTVSCYLEVPRSRKELGSETDSPLESFNRRLHLQSFLLAIVGFFPNFFHAIFLLSTNLRVPKVHALHLRMRVYNWARDPTLSREVWSIIPSEARFLLGVRSNAYGFAYFPKGRFRVQN